jgi:putative ABC transport system permease protein
VERVTASFPFPLAGGFSTIRWGTEEALADNSKYQAVDWQIVRPGYFDTLRTRLLAGRTFTEADSDPRRNLVVVDQMLAAKAFPNESAVGKRILIRIRTPEPEWVEIIGVVAHQRVASLADPGREQVYFADGFTGWQREQVGDARLGQSRQLWNVQCGPPLRRSIRSFSSPSCSRWTIWCAGRRPVPVSP